MNVACTFNRDVTYHALIYPRSEGIRAVLIVILSRFGILLLNAGSCVLGARAIKTEGRGGLAAERQSKPENFGPVAPKCLWVIAE